MKLTKGRKKHAVNQSVFYKVYSKKKLAELLGISQAAMVGIASNNSNHRKFDAKNDDGSVRPIQTPKATLKKIHDRVYALLVRIETPDYLHSGLKGRSYVTNAKAHDPALAGFKLDITKFYPSTTHQQVSTAFQKIFKCGEEVSTILSQLLTVDGHLPTGSAVSQPLAYWVHSQLFDRIAKICADDDGSMSLYVDDVYVSIPAVKRRQIKQIERLIEKSGLQSHKLIVYGAKTTKVVTGVAIGSDGTKLPNKRHLKLAESRSKLHSTPKDSREHLEAALSVAGQVSSAAQIDSTFIERAKVKAAYVKHLLSLALKRPHRAGGGANSAHIPESSTRYGDDPPWD